MLNKKWTSLPVRFNPFNLFYIRVLVLPFTLKNLLLICSAKSFKGFKKINLLWERDKFLFLTPWITNLPKILSILTFFSEKFFKMLQVSCKSSFYKMMEFDLLGTLMILRYIYISIFPFMR